jgi:guanine deaminase
MDYMQTAIEEAYRGIGAGHGGPFGAVVVKDGRIIGRGHNCVIRDQDATMHGEIAAIRDASRALGTFDLSGCELYTTAEPCPMCLCASLWANIDKIHYGCTRHDTADIGFRDNAFYETICDPGERVIQRGRAQCLELFEAYRNMDKTPY